MKWGKISPLEEIMRGLNQLLFTSAALLTPACVSKKHVESLENKVMVLEGELSKLRKNHAVTLHQTETALMLVALLDEREAEITAELNAVQNTFIATVKNDCDINDLSPGPVVMDTFGGQPFAGVDMMKYERLLLSSKEFTCINNVMRTFTLPENCLLVNDTHVTTQPHVRLTCDLSSEPSLQGDFLHRHGY